MSFLQRIMSVEKLAWSRMGAYNVNLYTLVMVENFGKIYAKKINVDTIWYLEIYLKNSNAWYGYSTDLST